MILGVANVLNDSTTRDKVEEQVEYVFDGKLSVNIMPAADFGMGDGALVEVWENGFEESTFEFVVGKRAIQHASRGIFVTYLCVEIMKRLDERYDNLHAHTGG